MQEHPRVSLLVTDEPGAPLPPQAWPRVALQADADFLQRESDDWYRARAAYQARFPDAAPTFELGDFSLVALRPRAARLVAGFGRAYALVGDALDAWLRV
jgi:putative heme iron utilization protein